MHMPHSGTVPRFPIPGLLRLGFAGKRDDVRWAHRVEAWTTRERVDRAVLIPAHVATMVSDLRWPSRGNVCPMTRSLREDIREAIPRQHDTALGKELNGRAIVCRADLSVLLIPTAPERSVAVDLVFRHAEALLSRPLLKLGFCQFGELRSGMGRLSP